MATDPNQSGLNGLGALVGGGLGLLTANQTPLNLQKISQAGIVGQAGLQNILSGGIGPGVNQNVLQSYQNPFLQQTIDATNRPLTNQFNNQILPSINDAFSNAGSFGSGRQAALTGTATQNFTQQLNDNAAKLQNNAYNAAFQAAANAGTQQYAGQANAANSLYTPATQIAGESPLLSAISGAATGGNLANALASGNFGSIGNAISGGLSKIGGAISNGLGLGGANGGTPAVQVTNAGDVPAGQTPVDDQGNPMPGFSQNADGSYTYDNSTVQSLPAPQAPVMLNDNLGSVADSSPVASSSLDTSSIFDNFF